ncbi:MAG: permease-like cell division protein FtsX [Burkholderiaceae bacterium]|nr:permease-like cell division protein FtsX [Burkholderiaceae bacterium]
MSGLAARTRALASAVDALASAPGLAVLALLLASTALTLPLLVAALAWPLHGAWSRLDAPAQAVVFAAPGTAGSDVAALRVRLAEQPGVASATLVMRDTALADLMRRAPGGALPELKANPLPDAVVVTFARATPPTAVDTTVAALRKLPRVDSVQFDGDWYRRWMTGADAARVAGGAIALLLGVLAVAGVLGAAQLPSVIGPAELRLLALFGAPAADRRRPFIYAGGLIGLAAGIVTGGVVSSVLTSVVQQLAGVQPVGGAVLDWPQPATAPWFGLIAGAALTGLLVGLIGGRWAGSRAIRRAQP